MGRLDSDRHSGRVRTVLELLGEEPEEFPIPPTVESTTPESLSKLEEKYLRASPEFKERVSRVIERGPIWGTRKRREQFSVPDL